MKKREIVFVTSNRGKIASAKKELKNIIEVIPFHAELTEPSIKIFGEWFLKQ
jgi:XTP/dITP diphosphohydrolase